MDELIITRITKAELLWHTVPIIMLSVQKQGLEITYELVLHVHTHQIAEIELRFNKFDIM